MLYFGLCFYLFFSLVNKDLRRIRPVLAFLIDHQQEVFTKDLQPMGDNNPLRADALSRSDQPPPLPTTASSSSNMPPSAFPTSSSAAAAAATATSLQLPLMSAGSSDTSGSPTSPASPRSPGRGAGPGSGTEAFSGHPTVLTGKPRGLLVNVHTGGVENAYTQYDYPPTAGSGDDGDELGFPYVQSADSGNPPINFRSWEWKVRTVFRLSPISGIDSMS